MNHDPGNESTARITAPPILILRQPRVPESNARNPNNVIIANRPFAGAYIEEYPPSRFQYKERPKIRVVIIPQNIETKQP
jgi:hypothetical protein